MFALLAGCAYFMVMFNFIVGLSSGQSILAWFFSPVIICGAAIVIIKLMKQARENENEKVIPIIFWLHTLLFIAGITAVIAA